MRGGQRLGLVTLGAALLLLSVGLLAYSRLAEWYHAVEVSRSAPPAESLPDRLPIPTRTP